MIVERIYVPRSLVPVSPLPAARARRVSNAAIVVEAARPDGATELVIDARPAPRAKVNLCSGMAIGHTVIIRR